MEKRQIEEQKNILEKEEKRWQKEKKEQGKIFEGMIKRWKKVDRKHKKILEDLPLFERKTRDR